MKLTVLRGLPASGKSTLAREIVKQTGNTVRLNKDLLREMLHFKKHSWKNENLVRDVQMQIALNLLKDNQNIIIDDTNLNPKTFGKWNEIADFFNAKFEVIDVDTDFTTCLGRDALRFANGERAVGGSVITKMALEAGYDIGDDKGIIVVDIDGTIADIRHRLEFAKGENKNWDTFFSLIYGDLPRYEVMQEVAELAKETGAVIVLVSARPETYIWETVDWIMQNPYPGFDPVGIIMRDSNDKRQDTLVKSDFYDRFLKGRNIIKVFDDRPSVIRMWRERGLDVRDVGEGVEF